MKIGWLLLHGFTGTPYEMKHLEEGLRGTGHDVEIPLLPGHGTSLAEFQKTSFKDWAKGAETAFLALRERVDKIFICGFSMGGTLALDLAARNPVDGLVCIASPVFVYRFVPWEVPHPLLPLLPLVIQVKPLWPKRRRRPEALEIAPRQGYEDFIPLQQVLSLKQGADRVRENLRRVTAPVLTMHCAKDQTVPVSNSFEIIKNVSSPIRTMELLNIEDSRAGYHLLPAHKETRDRILSLMDVFEKRVLAEQPAEEK